MKALALFVLAFAVALPASAETTATFQAETTVRATTSNSGTVTTKSEESSDMFLEIKGIEGESEEKKGNVEHEWKVEEGESAAGTPGKPKYEDIEAFEDDASDEEDEKDDTEDIDIDVEELEGNAVSVSAVEVRGWDPKDKQEFLATIKTHAQVRSGQDLENFAKGVLLEDENMEEISLNFEKITFKYRSSGKLFGFIPLSFTQRVELDAEGDDVGQVKVKMPWFSFLVKEDVSSEDIEGEAEASISENLGNNQNWDFGGQAEILSLVSNVLKTKHDTVKNSINNVR